MNVELLIAGVIVLALALRHAAFGLRWVLPALKDAFPVRRSGPRR
jgi:hypothetical protein